MKTLLSKFLYSAVSSHQDCSKRFTLYFPDRPVQSDTISTSLGSIQPYATINARGLFVPIPTTVYSSFIQLSELEQCSRVKKVPTVLTTQHRIRIWVLLVDRPKLYLQTCIICTVECEIRKNTDFRMVAHPTLERSIGNPTLAILGKFYPSVVI